MLNAPASMIFGLLVLGAASVLCAGEAPAAVELNGATASEAWVLPQASGVAFRDGELVLDGVNHVAPCAVLREPALSDMVLICKVYVEPKGKGVRAFEVRFHSSDSVSDQYVHVNRRQAILCWSNRDQNWNELARVNVKRPEGKWLDVKVECAGSAIRVYLDDELVISKSGVARRVGRVGFSTSQGLVRVKDIRIQGTAAQLARRWRMVARPRRHGTFYELPPEHRHTDVSGKLDITVGKPFIISSRIAHPELGAHEQPHLFRMPNGDIHLAFHKDGDIDGAERVVLRSSDKGKTWTHLPMPVNRHEAVGCLRDGTVLIYDDYAFRKEGDTFLGQMCVSKDGGKTFGPCELAVFNRPAKQPSRALSAKRLDRYRANAAKWSDQLSHALWRSVLEKPDGSLIACAHTRYQGDKLLRCICYHSTDKGRTWGSESTIAYDPNVGGEGFVEPVMSFCSNGDVLCIMRHGMWQARSTDGGKTWGPYKTLDVRGVDPDLCLMSNGVLACSYGRPGNRIMFSADGNGHKWTDRLKIYEYRGGSFGYTGICEVEPGKVLFVYDRRDAFPDYGGKRTTAIQGVHITVLKRRGQ
ncbi:MAG: exo-alpha-sialidase [Kiritimatiellae bacterium]|nr:exo-alpha-sialidase [Kiritimatiellia bacterium]